MQIYNEQTKKLVTPAEMQDGQIGVIRRWDDDKRHIGSIVQRYENVLITIGEDSGKSWPSGGLIDTDDCGIEILPPGTLLEI